MLVKIGDHVEFVMGDRMAGIERSRLDDQDLITLRGDIIGGDRAPRTRSNDNHVIFVRDAVGVQDMRGVDLAARNGRDRDIARPARAEFGERKADLAMNGVRDIGVLIAGQPVAVITGINDPAQPPHILKQVDTAVAQPVGYTIDTRGDIGLGE